jgi:hypothetical protein
MAKFHIFLGYIVLIMPHSVSWGNLYASRNVKELENMKVGHTVTSSTKTF